MTSTTTAPVPSYDLPLDMSAAANAANAALRAGYETAQAAHANWALVREACDMGPIADVPAADAAARRTAVALAQAAANAYGLVSNSACTLFGVTQDGRVGQVEDTTSGSDYLDGVQFIEFDGKVWTDGRKDEVEVSDFVVFFDTREQAHDFLYPAPVRSLLFR